MSDLRSFDDEPMVKAMEILAKAGYYNVKLSGTSPGGVRVVVEGGAPAPTKKKRGR